MKFDDDALHTRSGPSITEGEVLPALQIEVGHATVIMGAAATNAFFGGHIEPDYARDVQGRRGIYLATGHILGYLDRFVGAWAGPAAFVAKRATAMRASICAGDTITVRGTVASVTPTSPGVVAPEVTSVEIDVIVTNQLDETCATGRVTLQLPVEAGS